MGKIASFFLNSDDFYLALIDMFGPFDGSTLKTVTIIVMMGPSYSTIGAFSRHWLPLQTGFEKMDCSLILTLQSSSAALASYQHSFLCLLMHHPVLCCDLLRPVLGVC